MIGNTQIQMNYTTLQRSSIDTSIFTKSWVLITKIILLIFKDDIAPNIMHYTILYLWFLNELT